MESRDVQLPGDGSGTLLERDYWAVLREPRVGPPALIDILTRHFVDFPPPALVRFERRNDSDSPSDPDLESDQGAQRNPPPLEVGDELTVDIRLAGQFAVRVTHRDDNSLTLATLAGHPEAGRITFGAYRNSRDDVVFHIRSRARAGSRSHLAGFFFAGDPMQTSTWSDFINRLAASVGAGVVGAIHAEKRAVEEEPGDRSVDAPTFIAEGS